MLFVALAILESHRDVILRYLVEVCHFICVVFVRCLTILSFQFDEILKACIHFHDQETKADILAD